MTPTHQDTRDFIIIADEKRKNLFAPKRPGDEYKLNSGWHPVDGSDTFGTEDSELVLTYRRHRSRAWLRIADKPVEYPAWLKNTVNKVKWFDDPPPQPGNWVCEWIYWQPADPAPDAPVDEVESDFHAWVKSEGLSDLESPCDQFALAAYKAGRDYERTKK